MKENILLLWWFRIILWLASSQIFTRWVTGKLCWNISFGSVGYVWEYIGSSLLGRDLLHCRVRWSSLKGSFGGLFGSLLGNLFIEGISLGICWCIDLGTVCKSVGVYFGELVCGVHWCLNVFGWFWACEIWRNLETKWILIF